MAPFSASRSAPCAGVLRVRAGSRRSPCPGNVDVAQRAQTSSTGAGAAGQRRIVEHGVVHRRQGALERVFGAGGRSASRRPSSPERRRSTGRAPAGSRPSRLRRCQTASVRAAPLPPGGPRCESSPPPGRRGGTRSPRRASSRSAAVGSRSPRTSADAGTGHTSSGVSPPSRTVHDRRGTRSFGSRRADGDPDSFRPHGYQPKVTPPRTPASAPPSNGLSRRCASTPSSKRRLSVSSTPRP